MSEERKAYAKRWREANREKCRDYSRKWVAANKEKVRKSRTAAYDALKKEADDHKSRAGCLFCGESNPLCLDFHHRDRSAKKADVSVLIRDKAGRRAVEAEIAKCVVLCANCHRKLHGHRRVVVFKAWGWEDWIVNGELYCGKQLGVLAGKKCSYHYHRLKDETFYVASGKVLLRHGWGDDLAAAESVILAPGDSFHVPVGLRHQFEGLERSIIYEFSTQHFDSDSYRVVKGD